MSKTAGHQSDDSVHPHVSFHARSEESKNGRKKRERKKRTGEIIGEGGLDVCVNED